METLVSAKAALLQALITGPGYGLELIERVRVRTKKKIKLGQGSVYPALRALEREGFVKSFEGPALQVRGGRPRIFYELTAAGAREAQQHQTTALSLFGKPAMVTR